MAVKRIDNIWWFRHIEPCRSSRTDIDLIERRLKLAEALHKEEK